MNGRIHIIYPENKWVTPETVIGWAKDSIANNEREENAATITLADAIEILSDEGEVTFTENNR